MSKPILTTLAGLAVAGALASTASAHAHLVKAVPAAGAAGAAPAAISLQFSERVESRFSGFDIVRADGAKVATQPLPAADGGKTLVAKPTAPLATGAYKVMWRIVSGDGHRMTGDYSFTVR